MKRLNAGFRLQRADWTVDPLLARHRRPWGGLLASVLAHSLLLLLVLGLLSTHETASSPNQPSPSSPSPQVAMIYLPPPPPPPPRAAARSAPVPPPTPPPASRQVAPDAVHAPKPAPSRGPEQRPDEVSGHESPGTTPAEPEQPKADPAPPTPKTTPAQPTPATLSSAPLAPDTAAMISEARRLFGGGRRLNTAAGLGAATLPGDRYSAERTSCLPPPRPPGEQPELAQVSGIIYQPNHRPLGGALLQIVGTQYSTFSDERGYYRLTFDADLVTQCRTQYVRVTADGFRARDLILGLGPGINDVTLQRF